MFKYKSTYAFDNVLSIEHVIFTFIVPSFKKMLFVCQQISVSNFNTNQPVIILNVILTQVMLLIYNTDYYYLTVIK